MNFFPLKDQFESLSPLVCKDNIQIFVEEIREYTKNLSPRQRQKQIQILTSKDILYYVIFLKFVCVF